jgi:cytochrome P450
MRRRPMLMLATLGPDRVERFGLLRRILDPVDRLLAAEIRRRRADPGDGDDILSLLLAARDADGRPVDEQTLRDEIITLLMAGHETTATSIAWAFERLVRDLDRLERLAGDTDRTYADAVVKETLRLRPPIPVVVRRLQRPLRIRGQWLPGGALVAPSAHLVHRRAEIYPDPHRFIPERFLGQRPGTYSWIPFGGGVRRCLGAGFAMLEMRVVLAAVLRTVALEPVGESEPAVRRAVTLVPARGAEVIARAR